MSQNTTNQKENLDTDYLTKVSEIDFGNEAPKVLDTTDFFTIAKERRSVRHFDKDFTISEKEIHEILETAIQAPSSSNLQPWRFLVIQDQAKKEQLLPIANNQQQIVDASVVIAVLGDVEAYKNADRIYSKIVEGGMMTTEVKDFYVNSIHESYGNFPIDVATKVVMIDGGLVSMQLMLAAKAKGYDTVPMGGFDPVKFVEEFNVPASFKPVMLISLGKGVKAGFEKARLPLDDVLTWDKF
ncbi:nitroreductase family protein [Bacillus manliponensis]|uniref:nitroreductase family protein n=1 Tax=Bacillus manliponensis TaxID=574376 RepID=UPI003516B589